MKIVDGDVLKINQGSNVEFKCDHIITGGYYLYLGYNNYRKAHLIQELVFYKYEYEYEHCDEIDFETYDEYVFISEKELYDNFQKVDLKKYTVTDKYFGKTVVE